MLPLLKLNLSLLAFLHPFLKIISVPVCSSRLLAGCFSVFITTCRRSGHFWLATLHGQCGFADLNSRQAGEYGLENVRSNVEANRHFAAGRVWARLLKPKPGPPQSVRLSDQLGRAAWFA